MGLSRKLYEQALLIFKPTEATSSVLDLTSELVYVLGHNF